MMYRMKQNAAGLASICILSTMVMVMVSTTVCMFVGFDDEINILYPYEINVQTGYSEVKENVSEQSSDIIQFIVAVAGLTLFSMMGQMLLESVGNLKMRQAIPIPAQVLAGIVLWLTTLWEIPFCLLLAQKISTFLMLVIHVGIYSILSTSVSLKPWFALFPGAITSRLMCVVIKVMPNGLPFEPGQVTYSPELGRVSGLLIGIPAALLWFLVFWLAGRTWFRKQVAE